MQNVRVAPDGGRQLLLDRTGASAAPLDHRCDRERERLRGCADRRNGPPSIRNDLRWRRSIRTPAE
jgi:hypothetical protein